jgi:hypothetical protein
LCERGFSGQYRQRFRRRRDCQLDQSPALTLIPPLDRREFWRLILSAPEL